MHPDYAQAYRDIFRRLRAGDELVSLEAPVKSLDGSGYTWKRTYYMTEQNRGKSRLAVGSRIDITQEIAERERFERELQYQKNLKAPNLVASTRYNLTKGTVELMAVARGWVVSTSGSKDYKTDIGYLLDLVFSDEKREQLARMMDRNSLMRGFAGDARTYGFECRLKRSDGGGVWVHMDMRLAEDPVSKDIMAFVSWFNINTQKLTELALNRIAQASYDYVGVVDRTTGRFQLLFSSRGKNRQNLPPARCDDFDSENARRLAKIYDKGLFASDAEYRLACDSSRLDNLLPHLERDGYHFFTLRGISEADAQPLFFRMEYRFIDDEKKLVLVSRSNITSIVEEDQRQQNQLKTALERELKANRAKSEFLSNMSHDIRTPLNSIINLIELARVDIDDRAALLSSLDKLEVSGRFLLGLINDILDMSRIENGRLDLHPEVYSLREAADYIKSVIVPLCDEKGVEFRHDDINSYPDVFVDKVRLNQLLFNLLSNAVKFTESGGVVSIKADGSVLDTGVLSCDFTISDTGCGISEKFLKKIFTPFEQENDVGAYSGTGLGLAISKAIVDKMGGTIRIESALNKGTTIYLHIDMPVAEPEQARQKKAEEHIQPSEKLRGKRILVVEDHHVNREIVIRLLKRCGCEAESAENGQQALEMFMCSGLGYFDCILMDIRMPEMNGLDAARAIRELNRADSATIPIIAMTANIFTKDVEASRNAGMNAHLNKPIEPYKLFKALNDYCCGDE